MNQEIIKNISNFKFSHNKLDDLVMKCEKITNCLITQKYEM